MSLQEPPPPHLGIMKGFLIQGLDTCAERLSSETTHRHPITGCPIGGPLWAHRAAIVRVRGKQYDELITENPDAKLRYVDDDNELVIVGSSLELFQRLAESDNGGKVVGYRFKISPYKLKVPPFIGDYTSMHIFSINTNAREAWRSIEIRTQLEFATGSHRLRSSPLDEMGLALVNSLDDHLMTGKGWSTMASQWYFGGGGKLSEGGTSDTGDFQGPRLPDKIFIDGFGFFSIPDEESEPVAVTGQDSIVPTIAKLRDRLASLDRSIKRARKDYKKLEISMHDDGSASMVKLCATMPEASLNPVIWNEHPVSFLYAYVASEERILQMSTAACKDLENALILQGRLASTDEALPASHGKLTYANGGLPAVIDHTVSDTSNINSHELQKESKSLLSGTSTEKSSLIDALLEKSNLEETEPDPSEFNPSRFKEALDDIRRRLAELATPTPSENLAGLLLSFKANNSTPKTDTLDPGNAKMNVASLLNDPETDSWGRSGSILQGLPRENHLTSEGIRQAQEVGQKLRRQYFGAYKGKSVVGPSISPDADRWASYGAEARSTTLEEDTKADPATYDRLEQHPIPPLRYEPYIFDSTIYDRLKQHPVPPFRYEPYTFDPATAKENCSARQEREEPEETTSIPKEKGPSALASGIFSGNDKIANVREDNLQRKPSISLEWNTSFHEAILRSQNEKTANIRGDHAHDTQCSPIDYSSSWGGTSKSRYNKTANARQDPPGETSSSPVEWISSSLTGGSLAQNDQTIKAHETNASEGRSGTLFGKLCELFPERTLKESSTASPTGQRPFPSNNSTTSNDRNDFAEDASSQSRAARLQNHSEMLNTVNAAYAPLEKTLVKTLTDFTGLAAFGMKRPPDMLLITKIEQHIGSLQNHVEAWKKQALADMSETERYAYWKRSTGLDTEAEPEQEANSSRDGTFNTNEASTNTGNVFKEPESTAPGVATPLNQSPEIDPFEDVEQLSSYVPDRTSSIASFSAIPSVANLTTGPEPPAAYGAEPSSTWGRYLSTWGAEPSSSHDAPPTHLPEPTSPIQGAPITSSSPPRAPTMSNVWAHDDPTSVDKIPKCVETLVDLGFAHKCHGGRKRLVIYAQLAGGDLNEAIEIITEEQNSYREMNAI